MNADSQGSPAGGRIEPECSGGGGHGPRRPPPSAAVTAAAEPDAAPLPPLVGAVGIDWVGAMLASMEPGSAVAAIQARAARGSAKR